MEKCITSARSTHDGIVFYSNLVPFLGVHSIVTPDGRFEAGPTITLIEDILGIFGGGTLSAYVISSRMVWFVNFIILFAVVSFTKDFWLIFATVYFMVTVSQSFYQFLVFAATIKLGSCKRLGRFHAAEHMAVNAYNTLQRVPTMDELREFSRFSSSCGSKSMTKEILYSTINAILISTTGRISFWLYLVCVIIWLLIYFHLCKTSGYRFLQIFITNKPTDVELNVALQGLKELDKLEEELESDCGECTCVIPLDMFDL